ncbi:hypothetical protein ABEB36_013526 [Hypothenemus hampei]|uniref:Uncharacterized protein n=1 Tax=Hypothenemus hampei TaxID=57062 RepID=A0ABD1E787_HYPHA
MSGLGVGHDSMRDDGGRVPRRRALAAQETAAPQTQRHQQQRRPRVADQYWYILRNNLIPPTTLTTIKSEIEILNRNYESDEGTDENNVPVELAEQQPKAEVQQVETNNP